MVFFYFSRASVDVIYYASPGCHFFDPLFSIAIRTSLKAYSGFSQCNPFLSMPTNAYYHRGTSTDVNIEDLDVSGSQLTVEPVFNGTSLPTYFFNEASL